jgi:hypothetical protein
MMERTGLIKVVFHLLNVSLLQAKTLVDVSAKLAEKLDTISESDILTAIYCLNAKDTNKLSLLIDDLKIKITDDQNTHEYVDYSDENASFHHHIQSIVFYSRIYRDIVATK